MNFWYALYIKPRWEKKVARQLDVQGFEVYCPIAKYTRQWSDRVKVVQEPVFRGYIFIHATKEKLWESLKMPGVISPVRYLGKPAVIRDEEILAVRKFLNEFSDIEVEKITLEKNSKVRIRQGVMMNYEGIIIEVFGTTALVRIDSLGLSLKAQFDKKNLEKL